MRSILRDRYTCIHIIQEEDEASGKIDKIHIIYIVFICSSNLHPRMYQLGG